MCQPAQVPVVIGVGDIVNRSLKLEDALEPVELVLRAIRDALDDSGLSNGSRNKLQSKIDAISIVRTWTWPYPDLPGLLSEKLGVNPRHREYSDHGGNQPGKLFDEAARRISKGECEVAVLAGGEALASLNAFAKARKLPPPGWTPLDTSVTSVFSPTSRELNEGKPKPNPKPSTTKLVNVNALIGETWAADHTGGLGGLHDIGAPIHIYPLYENAFRAHTGQSIKENHEESTKLYADFAKVAERNEFAWNFGREADSEEVIGTVGRKNRMICFPYPLLMNAFNTVNLAAACILTSTKVARELGVPESKWVYPLGGAGTRDSYDFWERPNYHSSPCISRSIDAALQVSGLKKEDVDLYDFYSCFPIVPKLACEHLGLSITKPAKPITLLGGLTSFGGAGNNYSMHALTEMTRQLRSGKGRKGLILANGGTVTYQHVVCLSTQAPANGTSYPEKSPLSPAVDDVPVPKVDATAEGDAVVETYTVEFDRSNKPLRGHIVGRLKHTHHRFIANHGDEITLQQLASWTKEPIGREGHVKQDPKKKGRNLFSFKDAARL